MPRRKIHAALIFAQISMWLPLLSLFLFPPAPSGEPPGGIPWPMITVILIGWICAPIAVLWNLLNALRTLGAGAFDPWVPRTVFWYKIAYLPALFLNCGFWFGMPMGMLNPWMVWFVPVMAIPIALSMGCAWLSMAATSAYPLAQIVLLGREKRLTLRQGLVFAAMQLLFVLDVLGCFILRSNYKPQFPCVEGWRRSAGVVTPAPAESQS